MKKYMVITIYNGEQAAKFFDYALDAENYRMNAECGCGALAQVYEWIQIDPDDPEMGYAYCLMYS